MDYRGRSNVQCPHCGEWSMVQPDAMEYYTKPRSLLQRTKPFKMFDAFKTLAKAAKSQELVCQSCGKRAQFKDCNKRS